MQGIIAAREPRDAVEQDHDILLLLHQPLRPLQHQLGDLHVPVRIFIEGRIVNLAIDFALQVGHFLGPFIDEKNDEDDLGMIYPDRLRDFL